jgi:tetratricopeptide (TPR) repeat protein
MHLYPPPLIRGGTDTFSGSVVIEELASSHAVLLWDTLRSVLLWAGEDPAARAGLFLPAAPGRRRARLAEAAGDPDLAGPLAAVLSGPLDALARALEQPEAAVPVEVARACRQVAAWADASGCSGTALAFMQAAALADPADAEAAYLTGRLARGRAERARAECWFWEAVARSRRSRDSGSRVLAIIGLGNLHFQRGNLPAAGRTHARALRIARHHGLRTLEGMASHDLFVIADEGERAAEAAEHAAEALRAYGPGHPRLPSLAHDVAVFWMNRGSFAPALRVLASVLPHILGRRERLLTLGSVARAAGAVGERPTFGAAWDEVWETTGSAGGPGVDGAGPALLALAQGAVSLGDWERAEGAAAEALRVGTARGEGMVVVSAESVLDAARNGRAAAANARPRSRVEPAEEVVGTFLEYLARMGSVAV